MENISKTKSHIPVLLHESITALMIKDGDIVVDGTFGGGGHSKEIYEAFGNKINSTLGLILLG